MTPRVLSTRTGSVQLLMDDGIKRSISVHYLVVWAFLQRPEPPEEWEPGRLTRSVDNGLMNVAWLHKGSERDSHGRRRSSQKLIRNVDERE